MLFKLPAPAAVLFTLLLALPAASVARPPAAPSPADGVSRMELEAFVPNVTRGGLLPLRAVGFTPAGERRNLTQLVRWSVAPAACGAVDELDRFQGAQPGKARLTATCANGLKSTLDVTVLDEGRPDWNVTYIEGLPRADYSKGAAAPKPGDMLQWCAHVKNYGTDTAPPVRVEWRVDGKTVRGGNLPRLERWASTEILLSLPAQAKPQTVELVVDPEGQVAETSEKNNVVRVSTHSRPAGFWVEESTYRFFHRHQTALEDGANSWEDWAQRQVRHWNSVQKVAAAVRPGPRVRPAPWRVDRIVVVRDGALPLAGGSAVEEPDSRERSLQWMRGFPASYAAGMNPGAGCTPENRFFVDRALVPNPAVRR
jgi:hypothetical protein